MPQEQNSNSKDNIIKIAFSLFLKKGFKEVTINNIMEGTKLSKGAIYHHFKSKEDIYAATLEAYYFEILKKEEVNFHTGNFADDIKLIYGFAANLFDAIEHVTESDSEYPIRNYFSFQLESEKNEIVRDQTKIAVTEFRKTVKNAIIAAHENNQLKKGLNIEAITFQVIGLIEGVAIHHSTLKNNVKNEILKKYKLVFDSYLQLICAE